MGRFYFILLILFPMSIFGAEDNNPCLHAYGDTQYECSVSIGGGWAASIPCNAFSNNVTSAAKRAATVGGSCKKYQICTKCGERRDLGSESISEKTTSYNGTSGSCKHIEGTQTVTVSVSCHTEKSCTVYVPIDDHRFYLMTDKNHVAEYKCYMTGRPYTNKQTVSVSSVSVPLNDTHSFAVNWNNPEPEGVTVGRNEYTTKSCSVCGTGCTWEIGKLTAGHQADYPTPTSTAESRPAYNGNGFGFPSTGKYTITYLKKCITHPVTFPGWTPVDISIGGCPQGEFEFTVNSVGLKNMTFSPNSGKVYTTPEEPYDIYVLSEIKKEDEESMGNKARPPVPISFSVTPEGGSWPTVHPYLGGIDDSELSENEKTAKANYKYPQWSLSAPGYYELGNQYLVDGGKPGDTSLKFTGKAQGTYSVSANCGTDPRPNKTPGDDRGTQTRQIHVCNPKASVAFDVEKNLHEAKVISLSACDQPKIGLRFGATTGGAPNGGRASIKINAPQDSYELYVQNKEGNFVEASGDDYSVEMKNGSGEKTIFFVPVKSDPDMKRTDYSVTVEYAPGNSAFKADPQTDTFVVLWKDKCKNGQCSTDSVNVKNKSVLAQFPFGGGAWGESGGAWDVYAQEVNFRLLNNKKVEIEREVTDPNEDTLPQIINPMLNFTYGSSTSAKIATAEEATADSTKVEGYPIRVRTGMYCTEFEYEQATVGTFTFVSKITARQYLSSGMNAEEAVPSGTAPVSLSVAEIIYNPVLPSGENAEPEATAFNVRYVQYTGSVSSEKNWQFTKGMQACPDLTGKYSLSQLSENGVNNILVKQDYTQKDISYRREIRYIGSMASPVSKEDIIYRQYSWGEEIVSQTINGDTTVYEYIASGNGFGKLSKVVYPRGNQVVYSYAANGDLVTETELRGNLTYVTSYEYSDDTAKKGRITIATQRVGGVVVGKTKTISYDAVPSVYPDESTQYDENNNEYTTKTWYIQGPDGEYDKRPSRQENPDGTMIVYTYNRSGNLETTTTDSGIFSESNGSYVLQKGTRTVSVVNRNGSQISSTQYFIDTTAGINLKTTEEINTAFDSFGRPTTTTYLDGSTLTRTYGCCGVESETDRDGITTTYAYDNFSRVSYTVRDGITTLYTYDAAGNITATTTKGRNDGEITTTSTYALGKLVSAKDALNNETAYTYSQTADTVTNPDGGTQITTYVNGEQTGVSGTAVHPVSYTYGANWRKELPKNITTYTNMLGQTSKTVYADNTQQENVYNSKGLLIKTVTPAGRITLYEYDDLKRQVKQAVDMNLNGVIDGADIVTEAAYTWGTRDNKTVYVTTTTVRQGNDSKVTSVQEQTVDGLESWTTDTAGRVQHSKTERQGNGLVKQTVMNPDGTKMITTNLNGRTVKVESFNTDGTAGNLQEYTYDEFNRVASIVEKDGTTVVNTLSYTYDANGRQLTQTVNGQTTSMSYNDATRTNTTTLPGNRVITEIFYPTGERKRLSGADTYTQEWTWDGVWGKKATLTTWKEASAPQTTTWTYDNRGNEISKIYADNNGPSYSYDAEGNLLTRTWARQVNGQALVTTYAYDNAGRQTGYSYSDGTTAPVTISYDFLNRQSSITDASGTHNFTYGPDSQVSIISSPVLSNGTINYTYDNSGRKLGMQIQVGNAPSTTVNYGYDTRNRLVTLGNGDKTLHYAYLPGTDYVSGKIWKDVGGNDLISFTNSYDAQYRLTTVKQGGYSKVAYELNNKDQRTKATFPDGSYWDYSYDEKGQITGAVKRNGTGSAISGMSYGYSYDGIGNRITAEEGSVSNLIHYTSNLLNQYTAVDAMLPTYDADGNMLTNGEWVYTYNAENRLIQAEKSDLKVVMNYDYMGRRFEKKVYTKGLFTLYDWSLSKHYKFVYDGYKLIEIRDGMNNDVLLNSFLWQPESAGQDVPVCMSHEGALYYYLADGNKNILAVLNSAGNSEASYSYGPFGQILSSDGYLNAINPFRFSSEFHDDETGLVYYNYRYYSPALGRWINRDPLEEKGGINLYVTGNNNLIKRTDQFGLVSLGSKLWNRYLGRAVRGIVPVGYLLNLVTRLYIHPFNDSANELVERTESSLKSLIHATLIQAAKEQNITRVWQSFSLERREIGQAHIVSYGIQSAGYLLGTALANYARGTYYVKCDGPKLIFKQIKIVYEWFDEVDANSLLETLDRYYKTDKNTYSRALIDAVIDIGPLIESLPDLIGDKILMAGFYVNIYGNYIHNAELELP